VPSLIETGAKPSARAFAGRLLDLVERVRDHTPFLVGRDLVQWPRVCLTMAHHFPTKLARYFEGAGMLDANVRIQSHGAADIPLGHHIHQAENGDPIAVVAARPWQHVRYDWCLAVHKP